MMVGFAGVAAGIAVGCGTDEIPAIPGVDGGDSADGGDGGPPVETKYVVSGTVTGLLGSGLVLQNNGGDDITVSKDGSFTFPTTVAKGGTFAVTVKTQPTALSQTCTVTGGTGTVASGDVTTIAVKCETKKFTIGGTVSGLVGTGLALQSEGGELAITANGPFTFPAAVADGTSFTVAVKTTPSGPAMPLRSSPPRTGSLVR